MSTNGEAVAPATLHLHHSDDEPWHILDGGLRFRFKDHTESMGAGTTVSVPAGVPLTLQCRSRARYLIILTPRISALISALQCDRGPTHQHDIYRRFASELLEQG